MSAEGVREWNGRGWFVRGKRTPGVMCVIYPYFLFAAAWDPDLEAPMVRGTGAAFGQHN